MTPSMNTRFASHEHRSGNRRPDIQALRALSVAIVVTQHFFGAPRGGFVGVDVFFVVSGFLITTLLLAEARREGGISLLAFYARRLRRILPAALLVLIVTVLVGFIVWFPEPGRTNWTPVRRLLGGELSLCGFRGGLFGGLRPRSRTTALLVSLGRGAVLPRLADHFACGTRHRAHTTDPFGPFAHNQLAGSGRRWLPAFGSGYACEAAVCILRHIEPSVGTWGWRFDCCLPRR